MRIVIPSSYKAATILSWFVYYTPKSVNTVDLSKEFTIACFTNSTISQL